MVALERHEAADQQQDDGCESSPAIAGLNRAAIAATCTGNTLRSRPTTDAIWIWAQGREKVGKKNLADEAFYMVRGLKSYKLLA